MAKPLARKLFKKGLIESRDLIEEQKTEELKAKREAEEASKIRLKPFLLEYSSSRSDVKGRTKAKYSSSIDCMIDFFGADREIHTITEGDAEEFRIFLKAKKVKEKAIAENTIRKHCQLAKQFFNWAMKKRLLRENPFKDLKGASVANPDRFFFVEEAMSKTILNSLPSIQWKLIFALCRWGGLRCPSEVLTLRWVDVDWGRSRLKITSPKTEHHAGKATREIPLFPELKPLLEQGWAEAEDGAVFVITQYRSQDQNLRTRLSAYIRAAGFEPWGKLFQNLRSTRETELVQQFPIHVVCKWIGNSESVASKHYLQLTDAHFAQAIESPIAENRTQHRTQQTASETGRKGETAKSSTDEMTKEFPGFPNLSQESVAGAGPKPLSKTLGNVAVPQKSDVKSDAQPKLSDAELLELWHRASSGKKLAAIKILRTTTGADRGEF